MTPVDPEAFRRFEHSGWIEVADRYHDSFSRLTTQAVEPTLDAAGVGAGTRQFDLASGPGYIAAAGAKRGARVTGFDFSASMVAEARRRNPGLDFREADAESLPVGPGSADAVTIGFGMPHFARPDKVLAEAHRVLRPGGRLAFTVWDAPERAVTFGLILDAVKAHGDMNVALPEGPGFFEFAEAAQGQEVLTRAGFVSPRIETLPLLWRVDSADTLLRSFLQGGVRTRGLLLAQTPERLEAIRNAVHESARAWMRDGVLELPTPARLASAARP